MVRAAPLLLLALVCGAAAARELQGMDKMGAMADGAKNVAGATVGAVGSVAGAMGDAVQAGFEGLKSIHEAKTSGIREVVEAKISAARQVSRDRGRAGGSGDGGWRAVVCGCVLARVSLACSCLARPLPALPLLARCLLILARSYLAPALLAHPSLALPLLTPCSSLPRPSLGPPNSHPCPPPLPSPPSPPCRCSNMATACASCRAWRRQQRWPTAQRMWRAPLLVLPAALQMRWVITSTSRFRA